LTSKKRHESKVTQLQKDLEDAELQSRTMTLKVENLLEERNEDGTLFLNLQRSLNRLKHKYQKLEHEKRRYIEDRVVEEKDEDNFAKSWVRSQFEPIAIETFFQLRDVRDMEIQQMMDTTQTRILQNTATRDAQHEDSTRETKLRYTNPSEADIAGGFPIQDEIPVLTEIERDI
jgi:conjugal transfer/entry exclusion protein